MDYFSTRVGIHKKIVVVRRLLKLLTNQNVPLKLYFVIWRARAAANRLLLIAAAYKHEPFQICGKLYPSWELVERS